MNKILGTRSLCYKMKNTSNNLCRFCNSLEESTSHVFVQCTFSHLLWQEVKNWVENITCITFNLFERSLILGLDTNFWVSKLFMIVKFYIYKSLIKDNCLNFRALKHFIQNIYEEQQYMSLISHTNAKFNKKCHLISLLVQTIWKPLLCLCWPLC